MKANVLVHLFIFTVVGATSPASESSEGNKAVRKNRSDTHSTTEEKCSFKTLVPLPEGLIDEALDQIEKGKPVPAETLQRALISSQVTLRARAAEQLGKLNHRASIPFLIEALNDQSEHLGASYPTAGMNTTRYWANDSLKKITKQDFGFDSNAALADRELSIAAWKTWYRTMCAD